MFIVALTWCKRDRFGRAVEDSFEDDWRAEETWGRALKVYEDACEKDSLWSASICVPVKSTDYDLRTEVCSRCNVEIMYENPENFSPVCYDEDGKVHCEECCTCGDDIDKEAE